MPTQPRRHKKELNTNTKNDPVFVPSVFSRKSWFSSFFVFFVFFDVMYRLARGIEILDPNSAPKSKQWSFQGAKGVRILRPRLYFLLCVPHSE